MRVAKRYVVAANNALRNDNPPEPPHIDMDQFYDILGEQGVYNFFALYAKGMVNVEDVVELLNEEELMAMQQALRTTTAPENEGISFYRGKFYSLEFKKGKLVKAPEGVVVPEQSTITIMRDDRDEIHSIMADGKVLSTKEI